MLVFACVSMCTDDVSMYGHVCECWCQRVCWCLSVRVSCETVLNARACVCVSMCTCEHVCICVSYVHVYECLCVIHGHQRV